jgi:hypothetical protein
MKTTSNIKGRLILLMLISGILYQSNARTNITVGGYYAGWMRGWYNNDLLPAAVSYLSIDMECNLDEVSITYDDKLTIKEKVENAKKKV